ncbi:MAG: hypothetical protein SPL71_08135 [Oribacterium sp.]|nr:hypothetical protein [Oribacterium sp.]
MTEEMEPAFPEIARGLLSKEPLLKKEGLFTEIPFPYDEEKSIKNLYYETILGMMLVCVNNGSKYSKSVLTEVYKTYYKQEYGVLKKFRSMSSDELTDFCEGSEDVEQVNSICARIATMCEVMEIRLEDSCDSIIEFINSRERDKRAFWRRIEAAAQDRTILEKRSEERKGFASQITDENPEIVSKSAYENNREYKVLNDINFLIRYAMQERDTQSEQYLWDGFDLYSSMIDVYEELISSRGRSNPKRGVRFDDYSLRERILLAGIRHIASEYARLYSIRREELWSLLGISRMEIAPDTELESDIITEDMLKRLAKSKGISDEHDYRYRKLAERIKALGEKIPDESDKAPEGSAETESEPDPGQIDEEALITLVNKAIEEQKKRVKEAENKAGIQRILYEESREKVRALEKVVKAREDEHSELVALRELVYNLDKPELRDEEKTVEEMTDEMEDVKVALIGGQDAWANRIKKLFPKWVFITAGESLGLDRALGGVDIVFFLTDSISHAMYYKMLGTVRSKEIPFHFLHVQNTNQVIENIYSVVKAEVE